MTNFCTFSFVQKKISVYIRDNVIVIIAFLYYPSFWEARNGKPHPLLINLIHFLSLIYKYALVISKYWYFLGHGRFGVGLGTSLRVGGLNRGEVRPGSDSYGASTNYPSSGFDHSGSGVHLSGKYQRPAIFNTS